MAKAKFIIAGCGKNFEERADDNENKENLREVENKNAKHDGKCWPPKQHINLLRLSLRRQNSVARSYLLCEAAEAAR